MRSEAVYWILAAQALVIMPLLWQLPQWLWGLWGLTLFWRYASEKTWVNRTAGIIKWLLAAECLNRLVFYFSTQIQHRGHGRPFGNVVYFKTIECHSHKDGLLLILSVLSPLPHNFYLIKAC